MSIYDVPEQTIPNAESFLGLAPKQMDVLFMYELNLYSDKHRHSCVFCPF